MQKKLLLIGAAVFLTALNAQARIGYTLDECKTAYGEGEPVFSHLDASQDINIADFWLFHRGNLKISVWFNEEKGDVWIIHYKKYAPFTNVEIVSLLKENRSGKWVKYPKDDHTFYDNGPLRAATGYNEDGYYFLAIKNIKI